jgi:hypothetical protein
MEIQNSNILNKKISILHTALEQADEKINELEKDLKLEKNNNSNILKILKENEIIIKKNYDFIYDLEYELNEKKQKIIDLEKKRIKEEKFEKSLIQPLLNVQNEIINYQDLKNNIQNLKDENKKLYLENEKLYFSLKEKEQKIEELENEIVKNINNNLNKEINTEKEENIHSSLYQEIQIADKKSQLNQLKLEIKELNEYKNNLKHEILILNDNIKVLQNRQEKLNDDLKEYKEKKFCCFL